MEPVLISPEAAAAALSVSRTVVYALMNSGELPSCLIGRSRRLLASDVRAYAVGLMESPHATPAAVPNATRGRARAAA